MMHQYYTSKIAHTFAEIAFLSNIAYPKCATL